MPGIVQVAAIIAKEALIILENELGIADRVYRAYEEEYDKNINGYKIGDTLTIRKPAQYVIRTGPVMSSQDTIEGTTSIVINRYQGVDFNFTSTDLSLKLGVDSLKERVIKPAIVELADKVDLDIYSLFSDVNNWVGTAGNLITNFASFAAGTARLNNGAVPLDMRTACVTPDDAASIKGAISGPASIFAQDIVSAAYRRGQMPDIDNCMTYMAQNIATLTTGTRTNGTNNSTVPTTYLATKDTGTQNMTITGLGANATIAAGEVFTFAGVFDVNPVNKGVQNYLKQFVVTTAATASAGGAATVTVRPAMIATGAYQNISAAPAAAAVLTWKGAASTAFRQNMIFHKNAFALCIVPLVNPPGAVNVTRVSHKGISLRLAPVWDGVNDNNSWRLDLLYGLKVIDERLATRISGT